MTRRSLLIAALAMAVLPGRKPAIASNATTTVVKPPPVPIDSEAARWWLERRFPEEFSRSTAANPAAVAF